MSIFTARLFRQRRRANDFLEYIHSLNALRNKPRWYNAITTNCTTSIRTQHPRNERVPWDWRILLNGKGDELMYERHVIVTGGLPFAELKTRSLIDTRARAANDSPDFSTADQERSRLSRFRPMRHGNIAVRIIEEFLRSSREIDAGRHLRQRPGAGLLDGMPGSHAGARHAAYSRYSATGDPASSRLSTIIS